MLFPTPLIHGKLVRRYKRFLSDIELDSGEVIIAHCTNSGSMKSCIENGAEVYISPATDPKRKTRYTWEMIKLNGKWVGINTALPNLIAFEAISNNEIEKLQGYTQVKREVKFGDSRFDIYCENETEKCFVEVKNVTLNDENYARFPDAVTTRGQKHLKTLMQAKTEGYRAVMLYIVQRTDVEIYAPAKDIDPEYAKLLKEAKSKGVEIIVMQAQVSPKEIKLVKELPIEL